MDTSDALARWKREQKQQEAQRRRETAAADDEHRLRAEAYQQLVPAIWPLLRESGIPVSRFPATKEPLRRPILDPGWVVANKSGVGAWASGLFVWLTEAGAYVQVSSDRPLSLSNLTAIPSPDWLIGVLLDLDSLRTVRRDRASGELRVEDKNEGNASFGRVRSLDDALMKVLDRAKSFVECGH